MSQRVVSSKLVHVFLIYGYCRNEEKTLKIRLHEDIIDVCIEFHGPFVEILTFSNELNISSNENLENDGLIVSAEGKVIKKGGSSCHVNVIPDAEPVLNGVHCWRCKVTNPPLQWIMFGVARKDFRVDLKWNSSDVVSFQNQGFFNKNGNWKYINLQHFAATEEYEVDILLNIDEKKLNVCVVGQCVEGKEVKIWNFEVSPKGFVPYFNLYYVGQQLQCIKIPILWYGVPKKDLF